MAAAAAHQEIPEPLRYQTLALKVSIHCEGCKKKVKRVLQSIEGVYKISIDSQLHKVTITGNVDAETLIRKLLKTGKLAELWPDQIKQNDNNNEGGAGDGGGGGNGKKSKSKNKNKKNGNEPREINPDESNQSPSSDDSSNDASDKPIGEPVNDAPTEPPLPPPEKYDGSQKVLIAVTPAPAPAAAPAGGSRKKKKKGRNNHHPHQHNNNPDGGVVPAGAVVPQDKLAAAVAVAGASNGEVQAMQPSYDYLTYNAQVPTYVVSYSSVQPTASYGGAHYMVPPFQQSNYVYSAATPGSYYLFSEENANACSVM